MSVITQYILIFRGVVVENGESNETAGSQVQTALLNTANSSTVVVDPNQQASHSLVKLVGNVGSGGSVGVDGDRGGKLKSQSSSTQALPLAQEQARVSNNLISAANNTSIYVLPLLCGISSQTQAQGLTDYPLTTH